MRYTYFAIAVLMGSLAQAAIAPDALQSAADMMTDIMGAPDKGIPQDLLENPNASCWCPA